MFFIKIYSHAVAVHHNDPQYGTGSEIDVSFSV